MNQTSSNFWPESEYSTEKHNWRIELLRGKVRISFHILYLLIESFELRSRTRRIRNREKLLEHRNEVSYF